jgi:hypothetical protein
MEYRMTKQPHEQQRTALPKRLISFQNLECGNRWCTVSWFICIKLCGIVRSIIIKQKKWKEIWFLVWIFIFLAKRQRCCLQGDGREQSPKKDSCHGVRLVRLGKDYFPFLVETRFRFSLKIILNWFLFFFLSFWFTCAVNGLLICSQLEVSQKSTLVVFVCY